MRYKVDVLLICPVSMLTAEQHLNFSMDYKLVLEKLFYKQLSKRL